MTKKEHSRSRKILERLQGVQRNLRLLTSVVPAARLPLLTPAQAYGPDIERFRDNSQSLVSWRDKQSQAWHFSGLLKTERGRPLGWSLSFVDRHTQNDFIGALPARWFAPQLFAAHFELCDPMNAEGDQTFRYWQRGGFFRGSRGFAAADRFHVELGGWYAYRRADGSISVFAGGDADSIHLELTTDKPLVYHGQSGYHDTGGSEEAAAFYCSFSRLRSSGRVLLDGRLEDVTGLAWMDHEKLTAASDPMTARSERLNLQLDNGHELMLAGGGTGRFTSGSWIDPAGEVRHLIASDISCENTEYWTSPRTGARYPSKRALRIEPLGLALDIRPSLPAQELDLAVSTLSSHWEGLVQATGTWNTGDPLAGNGFMRIFGLDTRSRARVVKFLTRV